MFDEYMRSREERFGFLRGHLPDWLERSALMERLLKRPVYPNMPGNGAPGDAALAPQIAVWIRRGPTVRKSIHSSAR